MVAELWLFILPLTLPLAAVALRRAALSRRPADWFLFWTFPPMSAFFFALGWTPSFHVLWPLPAYLGLTVLMAGALADSSGRLAGFYRARGAWLVVGAAGWTAAVALHAACVLPGVPLLRETYGWDEVARRCRALHDDLPEGSFYLAVGGRTYPGASQLAFHLQAPAEVYGKNLVGQEALQYRYWAEPARLAGKDAVVVVEGGDPAGHVRDTLRPYFRAVEPAGDLLVPAGRLAHWSSRAVRFTLYRAYGYRPAPGAPTGESGLE